jgi:tetratricopeptide (TPR) repeat protein
MNYGLTQMEKGELATAYDDFERARSLSPGYSLVEVNLGVVSGALARHAEAEQHFRRAIELAPADSQSYSYYSRWLESRSRGPEAHGALTRAASLNPSDPEPRRRLALLQSRKAGPSPEDYLARSLGYHQAGRYQECIRAAEEALRLRPDYAEAYNNIAASYQSMARLDEAIAAAEQAVRLKPDFQLARNNLQYAREQKSLRAGVGSP